MRSLPQKPGGEEVVRQNLAKREEIIQVIQENIDDLRFQERNSGRGVGSGAESGRPVFPSIPASPPKLPTCHPP